MEAEILMRLARVEARYNELNDEMTQPEALSDHVRLTAMAREQTELGELVARYREYQQIERGLEETRALLREESDPELREMIQQELAELNERSQRIDEEVRVMLLPRDPNDGKNVIVEIRQGEGGDEAALFAGDLFRMYQRYA